MTRGENLSEGKERDEVLQIHQICRLGGLLGQLRLIVVDTLGFEEATDSIQPFIKYIDQQFEM